MKKIEKPKISIIVPIYNVQNYLEKCINSIMNQTYSFIEIILVNDGSTDLCGAMCEEYASKDDRIKVIHKENGGVVSARKTGANIASGDYIVGVDGDDWIESDRIELLVEAMKNTNPDMVYMAGMKREYDGRVSVVEEHIPYGIYSDKNIESIFELLSNTTVCFQNDMNAAVWMWAIRREIYCENVYDLDEEISIADDQIIVWSCLLDSKNVILSKNNGYHYVFRSDSIMNSMNVSHKRELQALFRQFSQRLKNKNASAKVRKAFLFLNVRILLTNDCSSFVQDTNENLCLYSKIKKNMKVVVYGAGKFGTELCKVCRSYVDVVLWTDTNISNKQGSGIMEGLHEPTQILELAYDYVLVAVINYKTAVEIQEQLIKMGVPRQKIQLLDAQCVSEKIIPRE